MAEGDLDRDLGEVMLRLRHLLDDVRGKLRVRDALQPAGFDEESFQRVRLVGRAMRLLGWERSRVRFEHSREYAYVKGSTLEREVHLELGRDGEDRLVVKGRST